MVIFSHSLASSEDTPHSKTSETRNLESIHDLTITGYPSKFLGAELHSRSRVTAESFGQKERGIKTDLFRSTLTRLMISYAQSSGVPIGRDPLRCSSGQEAAQEGIPENGSRQV